MAKIEFIGQAVNNIIISRNDLSHDLIYLAKEYGVPLIKGKFNLILKSQQIEARNDDCCTLLLRKDPRKGV